MAYGSNPKLANPGAGKCEVLNRNLTGVGTIGFLKGEMVYSNAGVATVIGSGAVTGNLIFGQSLITDTTAVGQVTPCKVVSSDQLWKIKLINNGTAAFASAFTVGTSYGMYVASNVHYADQYVTSTYCMVRYVEPALQPGDAADGSDCSWGLFRFLDAVCEV